MGTCSNYSSLVSITGSSTARTMEGDSTNTEVANNDTENSSETELAGRGKGDDNGRGGRPGNNETVVKAGNGKGQAPAEAGQGKGDPEAGQGKGGDDAASADTASTSRIADIAPGTFSVAIGPNPTVDQFGLTVTAAGDEPINVKIYDMNGRLCIEEKNITPNESIKLGYQLSAGHYIAHIEQGKKKEIVKLVKTN